MIQSIFVVLGIVHFLDTFFEKKNIWEMVAKYGAESKHKLIFDLCFCHFCLLFHMAWIVTLIYGAFNSFSLHLIVVPFVVSGLTQLIQKK